MNSMITSKRFLSALSLLLSIVLCFSACGGNENTSAPSDTSAIGTVSDDGVKEPADATDTDTDAVENTSKTGSKASSTSKSNSTNKNHANTTVKKTTWEADYLSNIPKSVKEKGITMLMWRGMHKTEQQMVDDFTKKTGIKVTQIRVSELEYASKLVSLISAKNSPDICALQTENFPGIVTKSMQPLDEEIFRLDDKCWNKDYMNVYKINNKHFGVAMSGWWNCDDCLYVTYYQPSVLKECGISASEMPYAQYKKGTWNWDSQRAIASKVAGANKGYTGISIQSYDLLMLSAGEDFVNYDGKKFTNNLDSLSGNSLLTRAWQEVSTLYANKLSSGWNLSKLQQGRVGLFTSIAYGMYIEGDWHMEEMPGGPSSIEVVPVAGPKGGTAYTPFRPKTWGVPKGAKNIEGAAYFLRYWLDSSNCDMDSTFLNKQCKEVWDIITKPTHKKKARSASGAVDYSDGGAYDDLCWDLYITTSANISTMLDKKKNLINNSINKANRDLQRIK